MCRIDDFIEVTSIDEKKDPNERFIQAIDENTIEGCFKNLFIKHFSDDWKSVFNNIPNLENSLASIDVQLSEQEKCMELLILQSMDINNSILYSVGMYNLVPSKGLRAFIDDVALTYYSESPYQFFSNGFNKIQHNYWVFQSWLCGNDFCFSKEFFDDIPLNKHQRSYFLWDFFYSIAPLYRGYDDNKLLRELTSIASYKNFTGPLTKNSLELLRGLEFLKAWVKFDSQEGRISYDWIDFLCDRDSPWERIERLLSNGNTDSDDAVQLCEKWLEDTQLELRKLLYINANLNLSSDDDVEVWASGIESYLTEYLSSKFTFAEQCSDEYDLQKDKALDELYSKLSLSQLSTLMKCSVNEDIKYTISSKQTYVGCSFPINNNKWLQKPFVGTWEKIFLEAMNELKVEEQLTILSCSPPFVKAPNLNFLDLWNELFNQLIDYDNFPKKLFPKWALAATNKYRLNRKELLPHFDKSVGILRGELSNQDNTNEDLKTYHLQLKQLLSELENLSPTKALKHRLLLMRTSPVPFVDDTLSTPGGILDFEGINSWYKALKDVPSQAPNGGLYNNSALSREELLQLEVELYTLFSCEIADFCLSRLRLRKGEKSQNGMYESNQVIEKSDFWRQGYIKALTELGFDLKGKVHKTVNFIKKADPNEGVRELASECYKAVRRKGKVKPSIQDLKRGMVAAEWWLLISQRKELELEINGKEAVKTRRNLMRNP